MEPLAPFTADAIAAARASVARAAHAGPIAVDPAISIVRGDITRQDVDVIVNAANMRMRGGGGVDGAIHAAGGPQLLDELERFAPNGSYTGGVVATHAGDLPSKFVVHAVGPRWEGGDQAEPELLALAYRNSVLDAARLGASSVALPSISTGIFGFPLHAGARIGLQSITDTLAQVDHHITDVRIVAFDEATHSAWQQAAGIAVPHVEAPAVADSAAAVAPRAAHHGGSEF